MSKSDNRFQKVTRNLDFNFHGSNLIMNDVY